jgi:hypothetical protein
MQNVGQLIISIASLTRQFLNCWLEYVLSQPVDMDISVMFHFLRSYLGLPIIYSLLKRDQTIVDDEFDCSENKNVMGELIPQESYS